MDSSSHNKQKGLTLIELLIGLSLLTLVMGLVIGTLMFTINTFKRTESEQRLGQELNIFLTQLTAIHQKEDSYIISYKEETKIYTIKNKNNEILLTIGNSKYSFIITINDEMITNSNPILISPKNNYYQLSVTIKDKDFQNELMINTGLTRL